MQLKNAYCINLKTRPERWEQVKEEIQKFPSNFELIRFDAIVDTDPRIGCAESHLSLIRLAKEKKWEFIFVLEDDVQFHEISHMILSACFKKLPNDWDIFLGGVYDSPIGYYADEYLYKNIYVQGTHCLIYNCRSYDKLLSYNKIPLAWDDWLSYLGVTNQVNMYHICPSIAGQRAGFSDIKSEKFDWNDSKHLMKKDYTLQYYLYKGLYENKLDSSYYCARQMKDPYTREQAFQVIRQFKLDFSK